MNLYFCKYCSYVIDLQVILVSILTCNVHGQFDFNQVKTVVENVIDVVQQASENLNCEFNCPTGFEKLPNTNYVPISNGCGSLGVDVDLGHLPSLIECCNIHDICYGSCAKIRDDCDRKFHQCLNKACENAEKQRSSSNKGVLISINVCKITAEIVHQGVSALGCKAYMDAQKDACICIPKKHHIEL